MFLTIDLPGILVLVVAAAVGAMMAKRNEKPIGIGIAIGAGTCFVAIVLIGGLIGAALGVAAGAVAIHMWAA